MVIFRSHGRLVQDPGPNDEALQNAAREPSRVIGYHNAIDDEDGVDDGLPFSLPPPPSYRTATRSPAQCNLDRDHGLESPHITDSAPSYECTVALEGAANVKFEQTNPFETLEDTQWAQVYVVLRGTVLSIHQLQTVGKLSKAFGSPKADWPGRLIKQYTLQHAEVGVASDVPKHELVPRTLASAMWPPQKMKRMQEEAPHLFDHVRQYVVRLRLECDQLLLRLKTWEERAAWIDYLCMAIDIAPPLDDRTEPKYHTLPRRRRHRQPRGQEVNAEASMTNLIQEQERIMRERFPHLLLTSEEEQSNPEVLEGPEDATADPEAEDLDATMFRAGPGGYQRGERTPRSSPSNVVDLMFHTQSLALTPSASAPNPVAEDSRSGQKLGPTTQLDRSQELRYRRRCMPNLLVNSRRFNDVVIRNGVRWQIDWESKILKPYPEQPPRYESCNPADENESFFASLPDLDMEQTLRGKAPSTTTNDGADFSVAALESSSKTKSRQSKSWRDPGGWGRRAKRTGVRNEEDNASSSDNSEGISLRKLRSEPAGTTFGSETLRMLGI